MKEEEIVQAIAEALQQGMSPDEIVQGLVKDVGIPEDQAAQLVQAVMQQMGGGEGGAPAEEGGERALTAEEAIQAFRQMQIPPDLLMQIIDIILAMSPAEIDKLAQMVAQAPEEGGEAPAQEQQAAGF